MSKAVPAKTLDRFEQIERRIDMLEALVLRMQQLETAPHMSIGSAAPPSPALQIVPPDPTWIPILHDQVREIPGLVQDRWVKPCGQVGLYLTRPPREHENARFEIMRVLVPGESCWRQPTLHDEPRCSSCGILIDPFSNQDLDYLRHMQPPVPTIGEPLSMLPPEPRSVFPRETQQKDLSALDELQRLARDAGLTL